MSHADHVQQFSISAVGENDTKTVVSTRDFEFVVDEPPALGGEDAGPNPVEYLLGAWAGCLNVVTHLVAAERDIEIDGVEIDLEGDLDPRKLLEDDDSVRAGYSEIRVTIAIESEADPVTVASLADEIEDRCPVSDNIQHATPATISITSA